MSIRFSKIHGCGNDFIVASLHDFATLKTSESIRKLCDRNFGIGSDGIMLVADQDLRPDSVGPISVEVEMYNPDGSAMGMCGNGIRCVVRYLAEKLSISSAQFVFSVFGREIICSTEDSGQSVSVQMGQAEILNTTLTIDVGGRNLSGIFISVGNPHFVLFDQSDQVLQLGAQIELNQAFPDRTNVEFARVVSKNLIELRVWERGVGWTMACGTGACAAVVAALYKGLCNPNCTVRLLGGELKVECSEISRNQQGVSTLQVNLKGPAVTVYNGSLQNV